MAKTGERMQESSKEVKKQRKSSRKLVTGVGRKETTNWVKERSVMWMEGLGHAKDEQC